MTPFRRLALSVVVAVIANFASHAIAVPVTIFKDDFQTDTAGTGNVTDDNDPVIDTGAGDIGAWSIREGTTGNNFMSGVQVYNDTVPANGIAGSNNYIRSYRPGSIGSSGKPYATGWTTADTTDRLIQLDMSVWQTSDLDENLPSSNPPFYLHVWWGGAPQNSVTQAAWNDSTSVHFGLSDGSTNTAAQPDINFPEDSWHTVRVIANYSSSATQNDILPQQYTVSIDGGTPITGMFATTQNTVESILLGVGGDNEQFHYIDDVQVQVLNPIAAGVPGDYNGDGSVDSADYVVWRKNQGGPGGSASVGDSEPDGDVDDADYDFWRARFGNPTPGSGSGAGLGNSSVPEPNTILLCGIGALGCAILFGRKCSVAQCPTRG